VMKLISPQDTQFIPPPTPLKVTKLVVHPPEPYIGQRVRISVTVSNIGTETGSHTVEFRINGEFVKRLTVTLAGGASTSVFIEMIFEKPNTYLVRADWLEKTVVVRTFPPPHPVAPMAGTLGALGITWLTTALAAVAS